MNLGIKREMLGDINIKGKDAYLYCVSHIADFIIDNLSTVKHTHIQCTKTDINDIECSPSLKILKFYLQVNELTLPLPASQS